MPPDAESYTQVEARHFVTAVGAGRAVAFDFPRSRHHLISLKAVHYSFSDWKDVQNRGYAALSNNPNHLENPPNTIDEAIMDDSVYGILAYETIRAATGVIHFHTYIVPLYGLIVPQRQIAMSVSDDHAYNIKVEVFYTTIPAPEDIVEAVSRQKGKYRRT